ncbi:hypothetical protein D9756_007768 [Leucocoprinus leucothites]|uniref:Uncharacterized protein n=1 Tax=Leucocoprinus leucothites TaxID=201217 RepID=A0A8H5D652_9AGAR|nr:hypothetical protein D9756_007768 [Leucoagaricus leucothites]
MASATSLPTAATTGPATEPNAINAAMAPLKPPHPGPPTTDTRVSTSFTVSKHATTVAEPGIAPNTPKRTITSNSADHETKDRTLGKPTTVPSNDDSEHHGPQQANRGKVSNDRNSANVVNTKPTVDTWVITGSISCTPVAAVLQRPTSPDPSPLATATTSSTTDLASRNEGVYSRATGQRDEGEKETNRGKGNLVIFVYTRPTTDTSVITGSNTCTCTVTVRTTTPDTPEPTTTSNSDDSEQRGPEQA